ncbi:Holliday junction branch migration protein RuvA [Candidatus Albibeggiatoa sp. nov. NOAA]|uniref:Holliday junction branch migration protein RuvA n=1 Tax=Candidatus Albibeggiatoa sp. nov. NOAA TaxID=3162724 RepID=UPI0032F55804|nr:Holliday junction branch migration protein RuvA [Thiotrichaceae bacterium]
MIGRLRGEVIEKQPPYLLLDVNGVGYELEAPMSTFYNLGDVGTTAKLYTHLSIRDDAHILFGFSSDNERKLFRTLIKVNGVGPKLALSILSAMDMTTFIQCVNQEEVSKLTRIPGVGKKTAERLIIEMRDKLNVSNASAQKNNSSAAPQGSLTEGLTSPADDAVGALIALGYKPQEASRLVNKVQQEGVTSSEELIRKALQSAL